MSTLEELITSVFTDPDTGVVSVWHNGRLFVADNLALLLSAVQDVERMPFLLEAA